MTVRQQYQKQRRRVRALINRYTKAGYEVNIAIPKIPKRITQASVNRLSKITPEKVRKVSYAPSPETGEMITYNQFKSVAKKSGTPKLNPAQLYENVSRETYITPVQQNVSRETFPESRPDNTPFWEDVVISNFRDVIKQMQYQQLMDIATNWLDQNIAQNGETKTAEMLNEAADRGIYSRLEAAYREQDVLGILTEMIQFMDISAGEKVSIMKEYYENGDIFEEYYEV